MFCNIEQKYASLIYGEKDPRERKCESSFQEVIQFPTSPDRKEKGRMLTYIEHVLLSSRASNALEKVPRRLEGPDRLAGNSRDHCF